MEEQKQFYPYFKGQKTFKLQRFEVAKKMSSPEDLELLELWESMLTGRSAPVSKWIKDEYKTLGLNHLFTPSGFHLSAVMLPFMKFIKNRVWQLWILIAVGATIFSMVGECPETDGAHQSESKSAGRENRFYRSTVDGYVIWLFH